MLSIVKQTIDHFVNTWKKISIIDINIDDKSMINEKASIFVTIYYKWEVRWSAWNINPLKDNLMEELIENTFEAISKDSRFSPISLKESLDLKIRIDKIQSKDLLKDKSISSIDPTKSWVIVIKNSYDKISCILPNINPKLISWDDFIPVLKEKLWEKLFDENKYFIYEIKTEVFTNY